MGNRFENFDLDTTSHLPPPGKHCRAQGTGLRLRLTGDESVVDPGPFTEDARISRNEFTVAQDQPVAHSQLGNGHPFLAVVPTSVDRQRKERFVVPVEHQTGIGLLLEKPTAEQEEQEPGQ